MKIRLCFVANSSSSDFIDYGPRKVYDTHSDNTIDICELLQDAEYNVNLSEYADELAGYSNKGHYVTISPDSCNRLRCTGNNVTFKIDIAEPGSTDVLIAWMNGDLRKKDVSGKNVEIIRGVLEE